MPSFSMPFKMPEIKLPEKLVGHGPWIQWMMGENLPRNLLNGQNNNKKNMESGNLEVQMDFVEVSVVHIICMNPNISCKVHGR